jgi:hypothetical protein
MEGLRTGGCRLEGQKGVLASIMYLAQNRILKT